MTITYEVKIAAGKIQIIEFSVTRENDVTVRQIFESTNALGCYSLFAYCSEASYVQRAQIRHDIRYLLKAWVSCPVCEDSACETKNSNCGK